MTTIYHPDHPHFAVHKAFVDGSFANPDEPPIVESRSQLSGWMSSDRAWLTDLQYRIKPKMFSRTVTYAEPLRDVPADGTTVWLVDPSYTKPYLMVFLGFDVQIVALKNGMVFATKADAQSCHDALFKGQK